MQGESRGQLPKNLSEFSDAISQTKKKLYSEYDALAKSAGEGGVFVSTEWIINEPKHLENNRTLRLANPGIDGIISNMKKGLEEIDNLTVEEAQTFSQHLNQNLKAFYKNWNANDIGRSTVEVLVNNNLKKAIDESIENALGQGERYSGLKRQYGQLRSIEEEVAKKALIDQRKNAKNLFDLTDIYSANQVIDSLANLNPIGLVKWGATSLIKNWYKKLNDPNVQIKKLFENIDKEISQNGQLREKGNRWTDTKEWINEKLGRKTWNSKQSEYTSTEKSSSITSPWNIRAESIDSVAKPPIATTFSLWTKSITLNGKKYYHQHSWSSFKTKHTFNPTNDTARFVENFNTALQKWENFALIGKYKGNDVKIYFNNNCANHFIKHWGLKAENLVETINNYDAVNIWSKNRYVFEKELPNGRWLRAITTKNFSEITFFETKNKFKWWEVIEKGLGKLRDWAETKDISNKQTPKTVAVWVKSKFSDKWAYKEVPVIREVKDITLYQWGKWEWRQFWTENKKYAEQFGKIQEKRGNFYEVDNGNRMTKVYVEAEKNSTKISKLIWNSLENDYTWVKPNRLEGEKLSLKEAETLLTKSWKNLNERIMIEVDKEWKLVLEDGRHFLEAYRKLGKGIPSEKIWFNGDKAKKLFEQLYSK